MANNQRSVELFERSQEVIPGGVNSPVRAFRHVGGVPRFFTRGQGAILSDVDGNDYIDYVGSWGPLILGHANATVAEALREVLQNGTSFGAPTELEVAFAELLVTYLPVEMLRMVNSGTEATMTALRLARAYTGRKRLIKFNGCYHGHADSFLVKAGSGVATHGISASAGVPEEVAELTISIEFNDLSLFRQTLSDIGPQTVAAVIVEPVPGNMGLVLPEAGFLQGLRQTCSEHGILLIFDEVMSGFRVALGGAAEKYGIAPDLITYGKVIGGGLPVGAVGGKREVMSLLSPLGPVYQAGTLSGNPLAMAAGLAAVQVLVETNPYLELENKARNLTQGLAQVAQAKGVPLSTAFCGSMIGFFFAETPVRNFTQAGQSNIEFFKKFFHAMLDQGVYFAPSAFEAGFISAAHSDEQISFTVEAAARVLEKIAP